MKPLNVAIIGHKFMGRAHSHAFLSAPHFFDLPYQPVLKVACGRDETAARAFAQKWGWERVETDWRRVVEDPEVDLVDIAAPNHLHYEIALAAAQNGKHIFCEKPLAVSVQQAREMLAAVERAGVLHYLNHNYRRVPAISYARRLIDEGKLGRIYHWRGAYLQDWIMDPEFPLGWHLQKELAGAGPLFDLGSHAVDLARYLVGEIASVSALMRTFVEERWLPGAGTATFQAGAHSSERGPVTVEDAALLTVEFDNGALGSLELTRFAGGRRNFNTFEIYGSKGSVLFNLERMNELQFFSQDDPGDEQGFRTILVTNPTHPYTGAWWPVGHIIGYEHTFTHAVADFLTALARGEEIHPNFADGVKEMEVLEAAQQSAREGHKIQLGGQA